MRNSKNDTESRNDISRHIKGISCDVNNCSYNEDGCYCTAEKINVGPYSAQCSTETVCSTFKPKSTKP
ncbi:MAG: DUF1540 domain-containing protein [Oscillospiraceae bacterium]|nr:DUF1540 domain-containing protein [Oscillospiraceae bacterium]